MYGSFIPLQKTDVLKHLRRTFDVDLSNRSVVEDRSLLVKHLLQIDWILSP